MQLFVTMANNWKPSIIVTKNFVLDVYGLLDLRVSEIQLGNNEQISAF